MSPVFTFAAGVTVLFLVSGAAYSQTADELIEKGDVFYSRLQATEALQYYLPAIKLDPNNVRLLVRISREFRHLMSDAARPAEKLRLGNTAIDYAKKAVALAPEDPDAQLAVAISYGKVQPYEGNKDRFDAVRIIKEAVDKVLKLDPHSDLGWHILGRWYAGLADISSVKRALSQVTYGKLPSGTYEDAAKCFEKAVQCNPNRLMHYIELGAAYAKLGRNAEARTLITKGLSMHETEKDDPESKREGREVLSKLH